MNINYNEVVEKQDESIMKYSMVNNKYIFYLL